MSKIISFVDGSIYSPSVCDHTAWAATRIAASVDVVHVLGRREISSAPVDRSGSLEAGAQAHLLGELAELDAQRARLSHQRGRLVLDEARARLLADGVSAVTPRLRNGDIVEAAQELEAEAEIVVIGKRGGGADFARLHLGSNLERVLRSARKPVLVASRAFKPIQKVMVAFDGGPSVMRALDYMASNQLFAGLQCEVVSVGAESADMRSKLTFVEGKLRPTVGDVRTHLLPGEPEEVIGQRVESEGIDLLVMGAYGHSRIRALIIGSTTAQMIRACKIPVMAFH